MSGSLFEQTNYKDVSLKQLENAEYRDRSRYYQRIIVNFVRYDNKMFCFFFRQTLEYLYIAHIMPRIRCILSGKLNDAHGGGSLQSFATLCFYMKYSLIRVLKFYL